MNSNKNVRFWDLLLKVPIFKFNLGKVPENCKIMKNFYYWIFIKLCELLFGNVYRIKILQKFYKYIKLRKGRFH